MPSTLTLSPNSKTTSKSAKTLLTATICVLLSGCFFSDNPRTRTPGTVIDDEMLETIVERKIRSSSPDYKGSNIDVVSYNGLVLLLGQVPTEALKSQATVVSQSLQKVRQVHNELEIGGPISYPARTNDSWLSSKVKTKLIASKEVYGRKVKVVTEDGVVYLMGMLPRSEADQAVEIAKTVYGVQKIVKVFEYIDEPVVAQEPMQEPVVLADPT